MTRKEIIERLRALADAMCEETEEDVIESFLEDLNAIPLVRAEKDDQRCLIKVFLEDDLIRSLTYRWVAEESEDARQWVLACVVGASLHRHAEKSRKETENKQ